MVHFCFCILVISPMLEIVKQLYVWMMSLIYTGSSFMSSDVNTVAVLSTVVM